MASEDDIELDPEAPVDGADAPANDDAPISTEDLQRMLAEERAKTSAAEKRAADVARERDEHRAKLSAETDSRFQAQEQAITGAIATIGAEIEKLEADAAAALEEGNSKEAIRLTRLAARAEINLAAAEQAKQRLDAAKEAAKAAAQQPQPQQNDGVGERTKAWIAAHPRFNTDQAYHNRAIAAHYEALSEGIAPDSDAYFAHIETRLGERKPPPAANDDDVIEEPAPRRSPAVAAPPSRSGRATDTGRTADGRIRLSPDEREAADITLAHIADPTERYKAYAAGRERMKKEGRLH